MQRVLRSDALIINCWSWRKWWCECAQFNALSEYLSCETAIA